MSFADDMKAKIDELEIEKHLKQLADETEKAASEAVEKAGGLAHDKRDDIVAFLDKATTRINERTKGQYVDKVEKARTGLLEGLDKLAAKRRLGDPVAPIEAPESAEPPASEGLSTDPTAGPTAGPTSDASSDPEKPTDPPVS